MSHYGKVAIIDPQGAAEGFAELFDLSDLDISETYVQDVARIGSPVLGHAAKGVTELPQSAARAAALAEGAPSAELLEDLRLYGRGRGLGLVEALVNGELKRRNVETSVANLTRVEVTSGLSDNATLALGALSMQSLRSGMQVKPATP